MRQNAHYYYTVAEAARLLDVSRATVWRWIHAGRLRALRPGPRSTRLLTSEIDALVSYTNGTLSSSAPVVGDRNDIWKNYDPERVRVALENTRGILKGADVEGLKRDIRGARDDTRRRKRLALG